MHRELKDVVTCLSGGDISGIKIGTNLIMAFCLDGGTIWTLVNVLVNVFDCLDGATDFQVDVTVKLHQKLSGMRGHMSVVKDILVLLNGSAIFRVGIVWITILLDGGMWSKRLGKALLAHIVLKTSLRRARTMEHTSSDHRVKLWMKIGIRNLC